MPTNLTGFYHNPQTRTTCGNTGILRNKKNRLSLASRLIDPTNPHFSLLKNPRVVAAIQRQ